MWWSRRSVYKIIIIEVALMEASKDILAGDVFAYAGCPSLLSASGQCIQQSSGLNLFFL